MTWSARSAAVLPERRQGVDNGQRLIPALQLDGLVGCGCGSCRDGRLSSHLGRVPRRGQCTSGRWTNSDPMQSTALKAHRRTRRGRGNTEGTNLLAPNGARRTRRTALVLTTTLGVLDGTGPHCGPPFGTKRPQVQILSPRLTSSQVTALRGPPWPQSSAARGNNKEH